MDELTFTETCFAHRCCPILVSLEFDASVVRNLYGGVCLDVHLGVFDL